MRFASLLEMEPTDLIYEGIATISDAIKRQHDVC